MGVASFFITLLLVYYFIMYIISVYGGKVTLPLVLFDLQSFELPMQDSHPSLHCTKTWHHLYISDPFW